MWNNFLIEEDIENISLRNKSEKLMFHLLRFPYNGKNEQI